jgi:drug/metabolite transporter (DMT)-like permease
VLLTLASPLIGETGIGAMTPLVLGSMVFQIVVVSFVSYLVWFWLITRYPAGRLAAFSFLTPLLGVPAGGVLLAEPVSWALAVSVVLVAIGIYLVNRAPSAK